MIIPPDDEVRLTLEEAERYFSEVQAAFDPVKKKYSGLRKTFRKGIGEADSTTLSDCIGILKSLSMNNSLRQMQTQECSTFLTKVSNLEQEIYLLLGEYEYIGIPVVPKKK